MSEKTFAREYRVNQFSAPLRVKLLSIPNLRFRFDFRGKFHVNFREVKKVKISFALHTEKNG